MQLSKITLIVTIALLFFINATAQLFLNSLPYIGLGMYFDQDTLITKRFNTQATFYKGDFLNSYRIEFVNTPFDHYGNADYTFQYVDNKLIGVKINYSFTADELDDFERLFSTLLLDLNNSKLYNPLKNYSTINKEDVIKSVKANCFATTDKKNKNYKPIKVKYYGYKVWNVTMNDSLRSQFLKMDVSLSEQHGNMFRDKQYDGGVVEVELTLTSEQFQNFLNDEADLVHNYEIIQKHSVKQINLQFENGVYKLPVVINKVLTMNFILDLGASDVSISPDVFLVLYKAGTINEEDFIGAQTYQFADGSTAKSNVFILKSLQVGSITIENVRASISNSINSPLLFGQSALKKFNSYKIDNYHNLLILE